MRQQQCSPSPIDSCRRPRSHQRVKPAVFEVGEWPHSTVPAALIIYSDSCRDTISVGGSDYDRLGIGPIPRISGARGATPIAIQHRSSNVKVPALVQGPVRERLTLSMRRTAIPQSQPEVAHTLWLTIRRGMTLHSTSAALQTQLGYFDVGCTANPTRAKSRK